MKLKKQNVVCAHEFSWFAKKVACTTYDVLGIFTLISGAVFGEIKFLANVERQTLLLFFIKKKVILKEWIIFIKLKKQSVL